jgi:L-ascorbate metabolism protein UlaG (beta-lactamase superfamily)
MMQEQLNILPAAILLGSLWIGCGQSGTSPETAKPAGAANAKVTFVGNSGFLIAVGKQKVLIDAPAAFSPADAATAKPPFDDVDLILATHSHGDHFSASQVRQHMQNNPKAIFMSTMQAAGQLTDLGDRVVAMNPGVGSPVDATANGIRVEAIYLNHGPSDDPSEVFNNGYVVTIGAIKFFHTGDVYDLEDARQYRLAEQNIDLGFIQHYFFLDDTAKSLMDEIVGAKHVFPIHYELTTPAFDASTIRTYVPDAIIFSARLESWTMP